MADAKISALTALLGADVADGDLFAVVDVSANATKKITKLELSAALGGGANPPDGILFLSDQGLAVAGFGWGIANDSRVTSAPYPDETVAVTVRLLGMTFNSGAISGVDLNAAQNSTVAANKWGVYRLLSMVTHDDSTPHFSTRPAIVGEMAYDSEALALAAVPAVPFGCVSMGIFVIQATGAGFTAGTDNLTVGDGVAALTIHQPEVLS